MRVSNDDKWELYSESLCVCVCGVCEDEYLTKKIQFILIDSASSAVRI